MKIEVRKIPNHSSFVPLNNLSSSFDSPMPNKLGSMFKRIPKKAKEAKNMMMKLISVLRKILDIRIVMKIESLVKTAKMDIESNFMQYFAAKAKRLPARPLKRKMFIKFGVFVYKGSFKYFEAKIAAKMLKVALTWASWKGVWVD